jgi:hypothetical protein
MLQLVSTSFLDARPTDMTDARKYLTQLDALGTPAALWRLLAHTDFAEHAMTLNDIGTAVSDARTAVAAAEQMDQSDRIDWVYPVLFAYQTLAEPLAIQSSGPTALALFDTVATTLLPLRPRGSREWKRLQTNIEHARSPYSLFGTDAKTLTATHWYNLQGDSAPRPRQGRVSLLVFVDASCGGRCYPTYATIRRLRAKYAKTGLDVIFLASTHQYFRNHPMPMANVESDSTASYFVNFLQFPVPLAMEETQFKRIPDGRMRGAETANEKAYDRGRNAVLVNAQGTVVLVDSLKPNREMTWNATIQQALHSQTQH